jgi:Tol biopolymer transport system component
VSDRDGNRELYVMNADGANPVRLTNQNGSDTDPAWSPDGRRIAFSSDRDGNAEIYVMNPDGTGVTRITSSVSDEIQPAWSPDGSKLAFEQACTSNTQQCIPLILVMNADGSRRTVIINGREPAWSPDGRKIAYVSVVCDYYGYYGGGCESAGIRIVGTDGKGDVEVVSTPASRPAWRH